MATHDNNYYMNHIQCFTSGECLEPGTAVIFVTAEHSEHLLNSTVFAQVHGHVNVDLRWLTSSIKLSDVFIVSPQDPAVHFSSDPVPAGVQNTSSPIFTTSKVPLSPTSLIKNGVLVEFSIPKDILPSFKGLVASITYYITITVQSPEHSQSMHFPITLNGVGSSAKTYAKRHAGMVAYSAASLPLESFMSVSNTDSPGDLDGGSNPFQNTKNNIYRISDEDYICNLLLDQNPISPPHDLSVYLDFSSGVQRCVAVKASLIMSEQRPDSSRIQDKLLSSVVRSAVDAESLTLALHFRADLCNNFESPLFKVVYMLDIEFTLEAPTSASSSLDLSRSVVLDGTELPRLSFSVPLRVLSEIQQQQQNIEALPTSRQYSHRCLAARYEVL